MRLRLLSEWSAERKGNFAVRELAPLLAEKRIKNTIKITKLAVVIVIVFLILLPPFTSTVIPKER